jgi:hypothetical protein
MSIAVGLQQLSLSRLPEWEVRDLLRKILTGLC